VALTDQATGQATNNIAYGSPVKVSATFVSAQNLPIASAVVTFAVSPDNLITMTPAIGTALTDANGVATILVNSASLTAAGAGSITASATSGSSTYTGKANFQVGAASVTLSNLTVGQSPLSPYGTTSVRVTVNIAGSPATTPIPVVFSSVCSAQGKATLPASVQTINGVATATYKDNGCGITDTITATVTVGATVTASAPIVVQAPGIASVQFVSATPTSIVLKGTGSAGMSENSQVVFKVVDNSNQPIAGANVLFDLTTRAGGILIDGLATPITKQTDAAGLVQVSVQAGTTPTPVWVTATVTSGATLLTTQSTQLTISTGRPAQDRFSLSVGTHNVEGWGYDGVTTALTVIASDRMGNRVPDGTGINFVSSGAQVQSSCTTTAGQCSVTFTTANPRPTGITEPSAVAVSAGRVRVLAYTLGEESFTDLNGDNVYQNGEPFNNLGNVFLDANENGFWDASEQVVQYNAANTQVCTSGIGNSPAAPSQAGTCDGIWGAAHVRQDLTVVLSGSQANINKVRPVSGYTPDTTYSMGGNCETGLTFWLFDQNRNPMPAGTKITAPTLPSGVSVSVVNDTVMSTTYPGGTPHSIIVKSTNTLVQNTACGATPPVGPVPGAFTINLNFTTPKGVVTSVPILLNP